MKNHYFCEAANVLSYVFPFISVDEVSSYISLGLSIITSIIIIAYRIWAWWKQAKADGKITADEIKDGIDVITDGIDDVKGKIDQIAEIGKDEDGTEDDAGKGGA